MALATAEEIATRLGWPLTPSEEDKVTALLEDCTTLIEDYCNRAFERRENETFELPTVPSCYLSVPRWYLPYLTVTSVTDEAGVEVTDWTYTTGCLERSAGWGEFAYVTVTGSWGYPTIPEALPVVARNEVILWISTTPGLVMERTGEREVEYDASQASRDLSTACQRALRRYRPGLGYVSLKRS